MDFTQKSIKECQTLSLAVSNMDTSLCSLIVADNFSSGIKGFSLIFAVWQHAAASNFVLAILVVCSFP